MAKLGDGQIIHSGPSFARLWYNSEIANSLIFTKYYTHTLIDSPLLAVSWITPVPTNRIYLNPLYDSNSLLAHNLQPSDAGTFTCSASTIGNFSAQLSFIGTN